jgi:outer membrane protein assembly factor BamE (lipoprotein component of BamABCDE complex)
MKKKIMIIGFILVSFVLFTGCVQNQNNEKMKIDNKGTVTLGDIQKDIKVGTTKSQVALFIGSPNIVTTEKNKEIWIYDKISTENSESSAAITAGGAGPIGVGLGFGLFSGEIKSNTTSNKTLTVIIIFNSNNEVEKIDYHTSRY